MHRAFGVMCVFTLVVATSLGWSQEVAPEEGAAEEPALIETEGEADAVTATEGSGEAAPAAMVIADEEPTPFQSLLYFLGRFHPVVLHFPIGLLVILLVLELITFFRPLQGEPAKTLLLISGAVFSVVAAVFGLFLSWSASFDEHLVFWHQWTGIGVAVGAVIACVLRSLMVRRRSGGFAFLYGVVLFVTVGALAPAGHYGAALTHGPNYLVTYLPEELEFLRPYLGEPQAEAAVDAGEGYFAAEIFPILEAKCLECHSGGKQDGELSLETREFALAGGETGKPAIVPGSAAASYMVELMLLPPEHPDVMPPTGEPQLTADETLKLAQWVNQGAPWGDVEITVAAAEEPAYATGTTAVTADGAAAIADIVDMKELMTLLFEPPYLALQGGLVEEPQGRSAMRDIYNAAFSLAEVHNLLFSRTDEEYMNTEEWKTLTALGRDASHAVGVGMQNRDYPAMKEAFTTLVKTCNDCHEHFELDVDPMELEPKPARGERD